MKLNEFGQPIGESLDGWTPPPSPPDAVISGAYVELRPLTPDHARELYPVFTADSDAMWTYMGIGPFDSEEDLRQEVAAMVDLEDWLPYAILVDGTALGFLSYLRIKPPGGVIEVGSIMFSEKLKQTREATEAIFLIVDNAIRLGYRRVEWKCDSLNEASRRAAIRFGFTYEGTFSKATHYKGRNRDTSWYAITDVQWEELRPIYRRWLDPENFDSDGSQRRSLTSLYH